MVKNKFRKTLKYVLTTSSQHGIIGLDEKRLDGITKEMKMVKLTDSQKRSMDIKDIAKQIRTRLRKEFPKCKFSVTIDRYSMGQSLDIYILSAPFPAFTDINMTYRQTHQFHYEESEHFTPEIKKVLKNVFQYTNDFNYDNSDSMVDYYEVNFCLHVSIGRYDKPFEVVS